MKEKKAERREKACKNCMAIVKPWEERCPLCGGTNLAPNPKGVVGVLDPEKSEIAKRLGIKKSGLYAHRI